MLNSSLRDAVLTQGFRTGRDTCRDGVSLDPCAQYAVVTHSGVRDAADESWHRGAIGPKKHS